MKICVIDDNNDVLELLQNVLDATGNDVLTADNGKDGLSLILSEKFDLILLDVTMPDFSGIDIVKYLSNHKKLTDSNILFLTASSISDSELQIWVDKGVKTWLRKPVEFDDLFEHVMEARII